MTVKYFTEKNLVPNDGSNEIIELFNKNIDFSYSDLFIYPDVHYKRGARVVNGMLFKSSKYIFPAALGVENCGFSFGKINEDLNKTEKAFAAYSKILKAYSPIKIWKRNEVLDIFTKYIKRDFFNNEKLYNSIGFKNISSVLSKSKECLTDDIIQSACYSLGSLGGGNHFFEIHRIKKVLNKNSLVKKDDIIFILHSDSISVGDIINLRYSNLSEWWFMKTWDKRKIDFRIKQFIYFMKNSLFLRNPIETFNLLYGQKDYRTINFDSAVGKRLIFEHRLAFIFGEMNRDTIVYSFAKTQNINLKMLGSFCHDGIAVEMYEDKPYLIQRNGVQFLGDEIDYFVVPGAMGGQSFIMENTKNKNAFFSSNHGLGRILDKHLARDKYSENDVIDEMKNAGIKLYRVGTGSMAEQSRHAFKIPNSVLGTMKRYNLGNVIAVAEPIAIMKG